MGITNLLPKLLEITKPKSIKDYRGERVAIDASAWLYTGSYACARSDGLMDPAWRRLSPKKVSPISITPFIPLADSYALENSQTSECIYHKLGIHLGFILIDE